MSPQSQDLSIGKLAICALGAAVGVLFAATVLIVLLQPSAGVSLTIALVGLIGAVAAMGFVSKRMTRRAYGDEADTKGADPKPGSGTLTD